MLRTTIKSGDSGSYVRRIERHLEKSLQNFIEIGQVLIEAERRLGRKRWLDMVSDELPFTRRTAEKLVKIAGDTRITDPKVRGRLPPHWTSLHELTQLTDMEFQTAVSENKIRPEMERKEIALLRLNPPKSTGKKKVAAPVRKPVAGSSWQEGMTVSVKPDDSSDAYGFAIGVVRLSKQYRFSSISLSAELLAAAAEPLRRFVRVEEEDIRQHTAEEDVDYLEDIFFQFETGRKFIDTRGQRHKDRDISRPDMIFEDMQHVYDYCLTGRILTKYTPLKFLEPRAYLFTVALRALDGDETVRSAAIAELQQQSVTEPIAGELLELFS